MKKILSVLAVVLLLTASAPVFAEDNGSNVQNQENENCKDGVCQMKRKSYASARTCISEQKPLLSTTN